MPSIPNALDPFKAWNAWRRFSTWMWLKRLLKTISGFFADKPIRAQLFNSKLRVVDLGLLALRPDEETCSRFKFCLSLRSMRITTLLHYYEKIWLPQKDIVLSWILFLDHSLLYPFKSLLGLLGSINKPWPHAVNSDPDGFFKALRLFSDVAFALALLLILYSLGTHTLKLTRLNIFTCVTACGLSVYASL